MEKGGVYLTICIIFLFVSCSSVQASEWLTSTKANFDNGFYNWTFYNSSGFVQLNATNTTGNYTSQIFDGGGNSTWNNISWISNAIGNLPDNKENEVSSNTFGNGNINMTKNILLFHEDNITGWKFTDTSGQSNNGTLYGRYPTRSNITINSTRYLAFPSMIKAGNGDLVLAYINSGTHVASNDSFIEYTISSDNGTTWNSPSVLYDDPGYATQSVLLMKSANDILYAFVERYNNETGDRLNAFWANSTDNGQTWSTFTQFYNISPTNVVYPIGRTVADNGDMFMVTTDFINNAQPHNNVWKSIDNGSTWTNISQLNTPAEGIGDEVAIKHLGGDNLIVVMRDRSSATTYKYNSSDGGVTWSTKTDIGDQVGILQDPEMIFVGNDIILSGRDKTNTNVVAYISSDNATTFQPHTLIESYTSWSNGGYTTDASINSTSFYVAYYTDIFNPSFPDIRGTLLDINNGINLDNGKINSAVDFDGTEDYIDLGDITDVDFGAGNWAISAWIKRDSSGDAWQQIVAKDDNSDRQFYLSFKDTDVLRIFYATAGGNVGQDTVGTITDTTTWHYVVGQRVGNSFEIYIDGVNQTLGALGGTHGTMKSTDDRLMIGRADIVALPQYFNGTIDEIAIWNRSLSAQEVLDIYKRGILKLNLSVQSCDDASCSGESWTNLGDNLTSPQTLSVDNNQYFQYKFEFLTDNGTYSPELYNITINYNVYPNVTLNLPANNSNISINYTLLNATVYDLGLDNMTVWFYGGYPNGTYSLINTTYNQTNGTTVTYNWTLLSDGSYNWTVIANDGNVNSTNEHYYFTIDTTSPVINLISPADSTSSTTSAYNFTFNVTDSSIVSNCSLIFDSAVINTLTSVNNTGGTNGMYNSSLSVATHTWSINCTDTFDNVGNSSSQTLIITSSSTTEEETTISSGGGLPIYTITKSNLEEGYSKVLGKNWKLRFKYENETHELKVYDIQNNSATIIISSNPITFNLSINQTKKIDLDNNGFYDFSVLLKNITRNIYYRRAEVYIKSISEEISNQQNTTKEDNNTNEEGNLQEDSNKVKDAISQNIEDNKLIYEIIGIILIAIVITLLVLKFKPKKKKK